ncbi:MAG: cytochrome c3 family protein [Bryobacterales bacterium]|nr:cytochrome c3 family protein [Bryobacterales bacterium]
MHGWGAMAMVLVAMLAVAAFAQQQEAPPVRAFTPGAPVTQPIPYSHEKHLAMGLKCAQCHKNADPGESMGLPATALCMGCHQTIAKEKAPIQALAKFHAEKRAVPWERVYQIPSYVFFSHRAHLKMGATCEVCHGKVAERAVLFREKDISMGACMDCHRREKAPNDCQFCHENR